MRVRCCIFVCALLMGAVCFAQDQVPSTPQPQPTAGQPSTTASSDRNNSSTPPGQPSPNPSEKKPSRLKRALDRAKPECVHVGAAGTCWDNSEKKQQQGQDSSNDTQSQVPRNQPPPRESLPAGESSSRQTQIDISPPVDDSSHEGADTSGVTEMHRYDPHRAAKDVEVGDFYFHKKNYRAAESRYEGALNWKPNDAIATYRLAQTEEAMGKNTEAVKYYESYLKILPNGDFANDAKEAIARLTK